MLCDGVIVTYNNNSIKEFVNIDKVIVYNKSKLLVIVDYWDESEYIPLKDIQGFKTDLKVKHRNS